MVGVGWAGGGCWRPGDGWAGGGCWRPTSLACGGGLLMEIGGRERCVCGGSWWPSLQRSDTSGDLGCMVIG